MKPINTVAACAFAFVLGPGLIVACGDDDDMHDADAATCNCEAPLAGRIVRLHSEQTIEPAAFTSVGASCNSINGTLLGGGCNQQGTDVMQLLESGPPEPASETYVCKF